jgi:hypothetical protein
MVNADTMNLESPAKPGCIRWSFGWTASFVITAAVALVGAAAWAFVDPFHPVRS